MLRIRDVNPRSEFLIPDPNFFHPGSRVKKSPRSRNCALKNLGILTQKIVSKVWEIWSNIFIPDRIPDPDVDFLPIPDRYRIQGSKRPRIRIRNTAFDFLDPALESYIFCCRMLHSCYLYLNFCWECWIRIRICMVLYHLCLFPLLNFPFNLAKHWLIVFLGTWFLCKTTQFGCPPLSTAWWTMPASSSCPPMLPFSVHFVIGRKKTLSQCYLWLTRYRNKKNDIYVFLVEFSFDQSRRHDLQKNPESENSNLGSSLFKMDRFRNGMCPFWKFLSVETICTVQLAVLQMSTSGNWKSNNSYLAVANARWENIPPSCHCIMKQQIFWPWVLAGGWRKGIFRLCELGFPAQYRKIPSFFKYLDRVLFFHLMFGHKGVGVQILAVSESGGHTEMSSILADQ